MIKILHISAQLFTWIIGILERGRSNILMKEQHGVSREHQGTLEASVQLVVT